LTYFEQTATTKATEFAHFTNSEVLEMNNQILQAILAAVLFGTWPLLVRGAGAPTSANTFIITLNAAALIALIMGFQNITLPKSDTMPHLILAGLLLGGGMIVYNAVLTAPGAQMSIVIPLVSAAIIIVSTIGGVGFFREPLTPWKVIGIGLLIVGIIFLRPPPPVIP
jgi:drug/metabolite transporter (DMT)-like permease